MGAKLDHLDPLDADMVVEHAKAIARERGAKLLKEAAALDAFGRHNIRK